MSALKQVGKKKAGKALSPSGGQCSAQEYNGGAASAERKEPSYFPIDRSDYAPCHSTTNMQPQDGSSSGISSTQGYSPMERFRSEGIRDQHWHGAASSSGFSTSSTSRPASGKEEYPSNPSEACAEKGSSQGK